ncbi:tRNA (adenosine(37)-N6)-threonylcarbamoyltransferase complex ATPase subunit type 1 TsaE [Candidatus Daviesbacteria bacterium]|nr:tRNA (adenosine(37)-N6)-threonylcarbamoyltransferase complex ATPase subunit type 1 TsaE [Candidatus Daviesbacteria bacterium]
MEEYITSSAKETKDLAKKLAKKYKQGVIALSGELGAGKTTFVQGFAEGLGIKEKIISPTFVLIRQHQIPDTKKTLFHIDLYRLDNKEAIKNLGVEDFFSDLVLIEWAEKGLDLLPKNTILINFEKIDANKRLIRVESPLS